MEFESVVYKRRMVRNFRQETVPHKDVLKIMDLAQHYPSRASLKLKERDTAKE